jgi:parallel beta-helix repeat protein
MVSAVNLFSTAQEKVISASCSDTGVTINVGSGSPNQYIYKQGYEYVGNAWKPITFSGATPNGQWFVGSASKALTRTTTDLAKTNNVVAYICIRINNAWKCGCRDQSCTSSYWQLQGFKASSVVPKGDGVSVKDTGAKGDGVTDDTAAIQAAVNRVGGTGGTVSVPDGSYMINALTGVQLKSNMTFQMSVGATLKALPNSAATYAIIRIESVSDVKVTGGTVVGERDAHQGSMGEWGMGINLLGATGVLIDGVTVKNCWGDGIYIGKNTQNVTVSSVTSDNNRRQGISITWADGVVIRDSVFKNTGGTAPGSGIDMEPNESPGDHVSNVQIVRSQFLNNAGRGINFNAIPAYPVTHVTIDSNTITGNFGGIYLRNTTGGHTFRNNMITDSNRYGIDLAGNTGNTISDNTITVTGNAKGRAIIGDHGGNTINGNTIH